MPLTQVRFARATDNLDDAVRFYEDGLGLEVLGSFTDHEGFDGVMLGVRGASWHLELTHQRGAKVGRAPTAENLIVLYFASDAEWSASVARMEALGYAGVSAHNPYWDRAGKTFLDVDGYGVVLQRGAWAADPQEPAISAAAASEPHSAQFLTDARDLYWNDDFLELMSQRLSLNRGIKRAVDVGSGLGHWTRKVATMLAPGSEIVGVEREPKWVRDAPRASDASGPVRISYREGTGEILPFPDESVDLVTCQTVLIHVPDPARVLAEMRRILKPGGTLLCAEPNNIGANIQSDACLPGQSLDDVLAAARLEIMCELGKRELGLGFNSIGETLIALLPPSSWADLRVWNSDRAYAARAPYPEDARVMLGQERAWHEQGALLWPEEETQRYFVAGGGDVAHFPALWEAVRRVQVRRFKAVDDGSYASAGGALLYLIAATRR